MRDTLNELYDILVKSVELDEWIVHNGLETYCNGILDESKELLDAFRNKDSENIKEELGDILMNTIIACILAEKEGIGSSRDIINNAISKIKRRRPYIEENRKVSKEESVKIWMDVKKEEKNKDI